VREFRFSLARKGVGLTALFLLFRLSSKIARFSLWVVDGARSCCCSDRSAAERGQPEGLQGRMGRSEGLLGAKCHSCSVRSLRVDWRYTVGPHTLLEETSCVGRMRSDFTSAKDPPKGIEGVQHLHGPVIVLGENCRPDFLCQESSSFTLSAGCLGLSGRCLRTSPTLPAWTFRGLHRCPPKSFRCL